MPVEMMTKARGTIPIQQRVSQRRDPAAAADEWKQFGIFDGLQLAQTGNQCDTADQVFDEAKRTWVGAGFSDIELFSVVQGKATSIKEAKGEPLPEVLLVKLTQYIREEIPGFPWYSGAVRGFLKGVSGRVYDVHKAIEKPDALYLTMYSDPKAIPRAPEAEEAAEQENLSLEPFMRREKLKLRQFNVVDVDNSPGKILELSSLLAGRSGTDVTCVTSTHPKVVRERLAESARLVWLSGTDRGHELPNNCYAAIPGSIEHHLVKMCGEYIAEARGENRVPVLAITSLDVLVDVNGEKKVKEFLAKMNYKLADFDGFGLVGISPKSLDEKTAAGLARAAEGM